MKTETATSNERIIELNGANFAQEVLGAEIPVLVHFWAGWSALCKAMKPLLESIAADESVPVKMVRVNVEHHEELVEQYGVRCVPSLLIFNRGTLQGQLVGRATEQEVREKLEQFK